MIVSMVKVDGMLRPLEGDRQRLADWKQRISDGQVVQVNFTTADPPASVKAKRYFHLIRDAYARALGYDREYAKDELCIGFGVAISLAEALEDPPKWSGHLRKIWGKEYVRKSIAAYTRDELIGLIEGSIHACIENGIDIQELVADYRREINRDGDAA